MSRVSRSSTRAASVCVLVLALSGVAAAQAKRARAKFEPPPGKAMVLIGCDNFKSYTRLTGDFPAGGVFWYEFNGDTSFFWHNAREVVGENGILAVHIGPLDRRVVQELLSGKRDENIRKLGAAFKEWDHPIFVAIGPEFDHKDNRPRYNASEYVRLFRRVHRIWDELGVTNVAYVWHSCLDLDSRWADYYPGDKYVDWFGISLYWPSQFRDAPVFVQAARSHRKPVIVMEASPVKGGASSSFEEWHGPFLRSCASLGARVICYNNFGDHPLIAPPFKHSAFDYLPRSIAEAWGRAMKSPSFLQAGPDLYEVLQGRKKAVAQEPPKSEDSSPARGEPVNLLTKLDPKRDAIQGDWRMASKVLTFAGDKEWSRIEMPYQPPEEYDLTVVAERVRGTEILVIGLVVGGKQAMVLLDGWGGGVSGLERIDGKVSQDNQTTHRGWRFINGRPVTIVCRVRRGSVSASCDGRTLFDWRGKPDQLSLVAGWKVPDEDRLFLGGWKGGAFRIRKLEIRDVAVRVGEQAP